MSDMPDFHSNKEPFEVVFSPWREDLAKRIIKRLHEKGAQVSYSKMKYITFSSGEILPDVPQSVRGKHVYFLHDLQAEDPNIALMRYLLSADALTRSDVASITCVFPNIPYLRQDRREPDERASISAAVVLRLIEESSPRIRTIITYHMHAAQETGRPGVDATEQFDQEAVMGPPLGQIQPALLHEIHEDLQPVLVAAVVIRHGRA